MCEAGVKRKDGHHREGEAHRLSHISERTALPQRCPAISFTLLKTEQLCYVKKRISELFVKKKVSICAIEPLQSSEGIEPGVSTSGTQRPFPCVIHACS